MHDLQKVAEHVPKITSFLLQEEKRFCLPRTFMKSQRYITEKMRAHTVDWVAELHKKWRLWHETLYVAIGIMDRYLAIVTDLKKEDLSTLGLTCLHIAGKYEEIYPPQLKDHLRLVSMANLSKESILKMEYDILSKLQFDVTFPSIYRLMERFGRLAQVSERQMLLASYLADTSLLDCGLVRELPSRVAASCIYATQMLCKGRPG